MKKKTGSKKMIPLAKPFFDEKEIRAVAKVIKSGWVTQGPKVAEFESLVSSYVGSKYAVAVSSATTALYLSLHIKGIGPGDEVIVPSFSFIASANVIVHAGATPVFIDIDPLTFNLNPDLIEKLITKKTKAIHVVARKHNLFVLEDAACAIGSVYKGRRVGSISEVTCLSFHPRKLVTTGDGGMILTDSKKFADRARILRHQGMSVSDIARHSSKKIINETYPEIGFNFRLTDIQAAVGVEQIKKFPKILRKREMLGKRYDKAFSGSGYIIPPFIPEGYQSNRQTYIIRLSPKAKISRDSLMQKLLDAGISTRRGVMASHLEKPYIKLVGKMFLPETERATRETICLPLYPQMTRSEQNYVINKVLELTEG